MSIEITLMLGLLFLMANGLVQEIYHIKIFPLASRDILFISRQSIIGLQIRHA